MMTYRSLLAFTAAALVLMLPPVARAATDFTVVPFEFDPAKSGLVASGWRNGIGCPTAATVSVDDPTTTDVFDPRPVPYADDGCPTGDDKDGKKFEGLMLVKTGPTANNASAGADLKGVKGTVLTELGYDIRKPGAGGFAGPSGSHCGAGAPRFNVVIEGTTFFIGCASPPPVEEASGQGWIRLRWGGTAPQMAFGPTGLTDITGKAVDAIHIIFDEGQDTGPDFFGLAVLDNIDVNGTLVGRGPAGGK
jgi:hypothetical protein